MRRVKPNITKIGVPMTKFNQCFAIPQELKNYLLINNDDNYADVSPSSHTEVHRDSFGRVISVSYYTEDKDLIKTEFYSGSSICTINQYRQGHLYSTGEYKDDLLISKSIMKSDGSILCQYEYEYNQNNKINRIHKKTKNKDILVGYRYDSFGRIVERNISINNEVITKQKYQYDILDRVVEYEDASQKIKVDKISEKNELISYTITDKMNNIIKVENHFADCGYICSKITVNGHSCSVNDKSYADNIMLKRPYTSEDDLDLIISNLLRNPANTTNRIKDAVSNNAMGLIDRSIEIRTLPISLRKRALYNTIVNAS